MYFCSKDFENREILKSLSFEPLKFALKPEFIIDLLKQIHSKKDKLSQININLFDYEINGINESIISKPNYLLRCSKERILDALT